jgi:diacylglycerol kinase (ATP)
MRNKFLGTGERGYHPIRKLSVIMSGLKFSVLHDFSVLLKVILSVVVLIPVMIFNPAIDTSILILATAIMISAEMFNTAIEGICDFVQPEFDEKIGMIKDIAAAATGIAIFAWAVVLVLEVVEVWGYL